MDSNDENTSKSANVVEEEEPSVNQHLKSRGRSNSPPWRKLLVYDCDEQAVKVKSEKNISEARASAIRAQS